MWIRKEEYERLKEEIFKREQELSDLRMDCRMMQLENENTLNILRHVIDITFEDNKCFETVVFQKFNHAPEIFVRGNKMTTNTDDEVVVKFKDGSAIVTKKKTI